MTTHHDGANFRIPLLDQSGLSTVLDRVRHGELRQLHLIGPRFDEENCRPFTSLQEGSLQRKAIFRLRELPKISQFADCNLLESLSLINCGMQDSDVEQLGELDSLSSLHLAMNDLAGNAIAHLKSLRRLTSLNLAFCNLTEDAFPHLPTLTTLDLSGNRLGPSVIARLANLKDLKCLVIHGMLLEDGIPESISELTNLTYLDLMESRCGKSISRLAKLTSLENLLLSLHEDSSAADLGNLERLTHLDCHLDQVSHDFVDSLEKLQRLTFLKLDIPDYVDSVMDTAVCLRRLGGLKQLKTLEVSGPGVINIDLEALMTIKGLTALRVAGLQFHGEQLACLSELRNLRWLNLGGNGDLSTGFEHLSALDQLTSLHLSRNQLIDDDLEHLAPLRRLEQLSLDCNHLTGGRFECLRGMSDLQDLDLSVNRLTGEGFEYLSNLKSLRFLNLRDNELASAGFEYLRELPMLESVNLGKNRLDPYAIKNLAGLKYLRLLNLESSNIGDASLQMLAIASARGEFPELLLLKVAGARSSIVDKSVLESRDACQILDVVFRGVALPHARIMVLGMGGVGKSNLVRRTFYDWVQKQEPHTETHNIHLLRPEKCRWSPTIPTAEGEIRVETWVWDFAGQLMTHGIHESFLADDGRTLFVIVLAADRNPDGDSVEHEGNRLRYWLQLLRYTVGSHAPVIIVVTRNDVAKMAHRPRAIDTPITWTELSPPRALKDVELDEFFIRMNVSVVDFISDFSACDGKYPIEMGLHRAITEAVGRLGVVKDRKVPRQLPAFKDLIDQRLSDRTMIERSDCDDLSLNQGIQQPCPTDDLLRILHYMGAVISWGSVRTEQRELSAQDNSDGLLGRRFRRNPTAALKSNVINPLWFKECVYAVTRASEDHLNNKPVVWMTEDDISRIVTKATEGFAGASGTETEASIVREALVFLGVCWEDESTGKYLFPRGLQELDLTNYGSWDAENMSWDFLPEHCVARLLVELHSQRLVVSRKKGIYVHGRNAALIEFPPGSNVQSLVAAHPEEGRIEVRYSRGSTTEHRQAVFNFLLALLQSNGLQGRKPDSLQRLEGDSSAAHESNETPSCENRAKAARQPPQIEKTDPGQLLPEDERRLAQLKTILASWGISLTAEDHLLLWTLYNLSAREIAAEQNRFYFRVFYLFRQFAVPLSKLMGCKDTPKTWAQIYNWLYGRISGERSSNRNFASVFGEPGLVKNHGDLSRSCLRAKDDYIDLAGALDSLNRVVG
jgi:Leucine-rich repeat (LRR) protein